MNWTGALSAPDHPSSKVLIIVGPTAVGKTAIAVEVAKSLNGEIVGLDSRQIYRYMEIGTAQPTQEEQMGIPHHLYGIFDPDRTISAGEYARLVEEKIEDIFCRHKQPVVCGGSGLYYRALTRGLFEGSASNLEIRNKLKEELERKGAIALLNKLKKIDSEYAKIVHPNNHKRLLRALEIYEITGRAPSEHFKKQRAYASKFSFYTIFLRPSQNWLEERIVERTHQMLEKGWVDEVKTLLKKGYSPDCHPMDSLGYRQILDYLEGKLNYTEMVDLINLRTRQYARRQMKWFKKEPIDLTLDVSEKTSVSSLVKNILDVVPQQLQVK